MKRITDPTFVYHKAASHSDPLAFRKRMKSYQPAAPALPVNVQPMKKKAKS